MFEVEDGQLFNVLPEQKLAIFPPHFTVLSRRSKKIDNKKVEKKKQKTLTIREKDSSRRSFLRKTFYCFSADGIILVFGFSLLLSLFQ